MARGIGRPPPVYLTLNKLSILSILSVTEFARVRVNELLMYKIRLCTEKFTRNPFRRVLRVRPDQDL